MKICPLCGKENKNKAAVCACGFSFGGNGHPQNGKTAAESPKKKRGVTALKIIALCLAAVIVLTATGLFIRDLRTMEWHGDFDPVTVVSDGYIMLYDLKKPSAKPLRIAKAEDEEDISRQYFKVYLSKSRSTLIFSNGFEYNDDFFSVQCDVYSYSLETLPYFPKAELKGVSDWTVSENADIYTFEKTVDRKTGLYQKTNGEEQLVTEKYKVYSVSADGKNLSYSNKNKKLKAEKTEYDGNISIFSAAELTDGNSISFSVSGTEITAELPEGISINDTSLIVTEKGSAVLTDKSSGKSFLYKGSRFTAFLREGEYLSFPDYPCGEYNVVKYDFSALA